MGHQYKRQIEYILKKERPITECNLSIYPKNKDEENAASSRSRIYFSWLKNAAKFATKRSLDYYIFLAKKPNKLCRVMKGKRPECQLQ